MYRQSDVENGGGDGGGVVVVVEVVAYEQEGGRGNSQRSARDCDRQTPAAAPHTAATQSGRNKIQLFAL